MPLIAQRRHYENADVEAAERPGSVALVVPYRIPLVRWSSTSGTRTPRASGRQAGTAGGPPGMPPSTSWSRRTVECPKAVTCLAPGTVTQKTGIFLAGPEQSRRRHSSALPRAAPAEHVDRRRTPPGAVPPRAKEQRPHSYANNVAKTTTSSIEHRTRTTTRAAPGRSARVRLMLSAF
jgi:hypothetical protein